MAKIKRNPSCRTQLDNWDLMGNSQLSFLFQYHISFYLYLEQLENERNNLQYRDQQNMALRAYMWVKEPI